MTTIDRFDQRLSAVERVVVDDDVALDELADLTTLAANVADLESHIEDQERRIADLEAAVQSIEGYVGNVASVNDGVERQAASAVATVDRLESRVEALEVELDDVQGGILDERSDSDPELASESTGLESVSGDELETVTEPVETEAENEDTVFEFGTTTDEEPTPEQSVSEVVDGDTPSQSTLDDGMDRPVSSANQSVVDSALADGTSSTTADQSGVESEDGPGLLESIKSRLS